MKSFHVFILLFLANGITQVQAEELDTSYQTTINQTTINNFKRSADTHEFFNNGYGYAVFPTIGKVAFVLGIEKNKSNIALLNNMY